jgi:hypothetical protein
LIVRLVDEALLSLFAAWWLLSIICQWKFQGIERLRTFDLLHLIPSCRFFAPRPSGRDYHIEYRLRDAAGREEGWRRIHLAGDRSWGSTLWHPDKRMRKGFGTTVRHLLQYRTKWGDETARRSLPYLRLLMFVDNKTTAFKGEAIQFRVLSSQDFALDCRVRLTFKSDWHAKGQVH